MSLKHMTSRLPLLLLTVAIGPLAIAQSTQAAVPPVKQVPTGTFGAEVDLTTGGNICTVTSKDTCQKAQESAIPGGFAFPYGVAIAPSENLYVADNNNKRVQELTPAGEFVLMFGKGVNETTGGDVCTEQEIKSSGVKCKAGIEGSGPGEFAGSSNVTVDQGTGDVYVLDLLNWRVQMFTPTGEFVLMFGKGVNETTGGDVCTGQEIKSSGVKCGAGIHNSPGGFEHAALSPAQAMGDLLAVGGPEDLVYVGDEHRVQEFDASTGVWKREISLTSISSISNSKVVALAIDSLGDTYLAYRVNSIANAIRKFNQNGELTAELPIRSAEDVKGEVTIGGMALDSANRLAVLETEFSAKGTKRFGSLYDADTGHLITEFSTGGFAGLAFDGKDDLFAAGAGTHEIIAYHPVPVAEVLTGPVVCKAGAVVETNIEIDCTLHGGVNPEGVSETEAWFQWGRTTALEFETPKQPVEEKAPGEVALIEASVGGLRPNATYYDRVDARDQNVKEPELLTSETAAFTTLAVPPLILGEPEASFVKASSAVLFGELNPENASTEYFFEYGQDEALSRCAGVRIESCPGVGTTVVHSSPCPLVAGRPLCVYGRIGVTLEAVGLQPGAVYHYRLAAESENATGTESLASAPGREAQFETPAASLPQAVTGSVSSIGATGAVVSGVVNPDGQSATYRFEVGVDEGALTRYAVVLSAAVGAGSLPVGESLALTGLQPGTSYVYRIAISSGYIPNATHTIEGSPMTFTTLSLPSALALPVPLAMLSVPSIAFPAAVVSRPATTVLANAQKLAKTLRACKRKRSRKQRAACQRQAHRQHPNYKQANRTKKG